MAIQFIEESKNLSMDTFDPNIGIINSQVFDYDNQESKFVFKIDPKSLKIGFGDPLGTQGRFLRILNPPAHNFWEGF